MQNKEILKISWNEIRSYSEDVSNKIKGSNEEIDAIFGIAKGGVIPSLLISEKISCKELYTILASSYNGTSQGELSFGEFPEAELKGKTILLVDEIKDTGKTIDETEKRIIKKYSPKKVIQATLTVNSFNCKKHPNFFSKEITRKPNEYVQFPWDYDMV